MRKERRTLKGEEDGLEGIGQQRSNQGEYYIIYLLFITKFFNKYFIKYLYLKKLINAGIVLRDIDCFECC